MGLKFPQLDEEGHLPLSMVSTTSSSQNPDDLAWSEVGQLGLRYARIPLALLCVEAFYWFITMPSDTLGPIQVTEAWIWNEMTNLIFGEGASTLSTHNGWMTRIELNHVDFPGSFNHVALYVSDECAGVHEMIFLSTLVAMTEGVPQKLKIRSIIVMCSIIYVLNIMRLVVFYPIAVQECVAMPNQAECLIPMWEWHTAVYQWGFLVVLVGMWLVWFWKVGGPARTLDASTAPVEDWRILFRRNWAKQHFGLILVALVLVAGGAYNVTSSNEANEAKSTLDTCQFLDLVSSECTQAQKDWDNAIESAWSMAAIGLVAGAFGVVEFQRPDEHGQWPSNTKQDLGVIEEPKTPTSRHDTKRKGSWKSRNSEEE